MLTKRETPQSIQWHEPEVCDEIIEAQPYDYSQMPDDMPSVDDWFRVRIWQDELNGLSLTG